MTAQIALLGWGSLLWEGGNSFDNWHGPWHSDGPSLSIEFSRISSSRGGALTLVIDRENGVPVRVAWCLSRRQSSREAIDDLRKREQTKSQHVGRIGIGGQSLCHDEESQQAIYTWAAKRDLTGVVWTDLRSNFAEKRQEPFTIDSALRYLSILKGESRKKAIQYFRNAPPFVQTPLRNAVSRELDGEI